MRRWQLKGLNSNGLGWSIGYPRPFLLDRGVDLVDGPGGSEATGGVAADAHGNLAALAGLRVARGKLARFRAASMVPRSRAIQ